ncbi:flavodoxin family protein [Ruminococcus sp.]|uniref:flavodoxin family protein n=1 Tax=Ruminococcus sp. TaxID=41978 RepID=UPI00399669B4
MAEKKIGYCRGCYYCRKSGGVCFIQDDMAEILQKMIDADVIVLASPVYFYSIDAQLKALIDRTVARWLEVHDKEVLLYCYHGRRGSILCGHHFRLFPWLCRLRRGCQEMDTICGNGVYEKGEILGTPAMEEAYAMGKAVQ